MAKKKQVYNRIKAVLADKGKTNLWLAEQLNVNKTTVSKWCTNDVQPAMETLFRIAGALNVEARELLTTKNKLYMTGNSQISKDIFINGPSNERC